MTQCKEKPGKCYKEDKEPCERRKSHSGFMVMAWQPYLEER